MKESKEFERSDLEVESDMNHIKDEDDTWLNVYAESQEMGGIQ